MCKEEVIKEDLSEIKYYHSRKHKLDSYMAENLPSSVVELNKLYAECIRNAPIRLYHVFVGLYIKGWTQEGVADEMNYTVNYVQNLNSKLIQFLRENIHKEDEVC